MAGRWKLRTTGEGKGVEKITIISQTTEDRKGAEPKRQVEDGSISDQTARTDAWGVVILW